MPFNPEQPRRQGSQGFRVGAVIALAGLLLVSAISIGAAAVAPQATPGASPAAQGTPGASPAAAAGCWASPPTMASGYMQWDSAPQMVIDPARTYTATIETNRGDIVIQLAADTAPVTVNNFVCLARAGYYDVTIFHRIIQGFMIQGGDPTGTGTGGPGYQINDELPQGDTPYMRGTIAMANAGPNTNGSQFFIVHQDQPVEFPKSYSIFGQVTSGIEILDALTTVPVADNGRGEMSRPLATVGIKTTTITEQ